jgi:hypothetical protein
MAVPPVFRAFRVNGRRCSHMPGEQGMKMVILMRSPDCRCQTAGDPETTCKPLI